MDVKRLGKVVVNSISVISTLLILWMIISFIDVNLHNGLNGDGPQLSWNFFSLLVNVFSG